MAVFSTNFAFDFSYLTSSDNRYDGPDFITSTAAQISGYSKLTKSGAEYHFTDTWAGTGIDFESTPKTGTITSYTQVVDSVGTATVTGLSITVIDLDAALNAKSGGAKATFTLVCASDDTMTGSSYNDVLWGFAGNDTINGGTGNDTMVGSSGNDTYYVDSTSDTVTEKAKEGTDTIISSISSYTLGKEIEKLTLNTNAVTGIGNTGDNTITGNSSDNTLYGKEGNDSLTGGSGNDIFVFDTKLNAKTNVDTITDFVSGSNDINLSAKIFGKVTGDVSSSDLVYGTSAVDTTDHFLYDTSTGNLYYDSDGSGKKAAVLFATLTGAPTLSAADLHIV